MTTTPYGLTQYYPALLSLQYINSPRAFATIEALAGMAIIPQSPSVYAIVFTYAPTSGVFVVGYNNLMASAINWNDSAATIQTKLRAVTGLGSVTVTGTIASQQLLVTMTGLTAPAMPLYLVSSTLVDDSLGTNPLITEGGLFITTESGEQLDTNVKTVAIYPQIFEYDQTLPLAVLNGYNLEGPLTAVGVQLDVLGKYAGVTRSAYGFYGQITLDDADFLSFILIAIARNASGSSLYDIQQILFTFFPGEILVFDYQTMQMDYFIAESVGSLQLLQLFITEGLLPKPMGVQLGALIYVPSVTLLFGFRTYTQPGYNVTPFNSYVSYNQTWPWLSYANAIVVP